jgi:hypothetical protein
MKLKKAHSINLTGANDKQDKISGLNDFALTIAGY